MEDGFSIWLTAVGIFLTLAFVAISNVEITLCAFIACVPLVLSPHTNAMWDALGCDADSGSSRYANDDAAQMRVGRIWGSSRIN